MRDELCARLAAEREVDVGVVLVVTGDVVVAVGVACLGTAPVLRLVSQSFFIINLFMGGVGAIRKYMYLFPVVVVNKYKLTH